jgi:hypothetical protein
VGSLRGEPGKSPKICLTDGKADMWKDFATGESGSNLLDLLCKMRGGDFRAACEEAANWLNNPERYGIKPQRFLRQLNSEIRILSPLTALLRSRQRLPRLRHHNFRDLTTGTIHDRTTLGPSLGVTTTSSYTAYPRSRQRLVRLRHHNFRDLTTGTIHSRTTLGRLLGVNGESLGMVGAGWSVEVF